MSGSVFRELLLLTKKSQILDLRQHNYPDHNRMKTEFKVCVGQYTKSDILLTSFFSSLTSLERFTDEATSSSLQTATHCSLPSEIESRCST